MNKKIMSLQKNINIKSTLLFAAFMLLQLVVLRMANGAGQGYLSAAWRDRVYLVIQMVVLTGISLYILLHRLIAKKIGSGGMFSAATVLCTALAEMMLFMRENSAAYLAISAAAVLCLGFVCGAVYLKMSQLIQEGAKAGVCIAVGYSFGIALQYMFQLRWTVRPVVALLLVLCAAALVFCFLQKRQGGEEAERKSEAALRSNPLFFCFITFAMLVFTNFYNIYIHHLQVAANYTEYSVYTWPRLLMIPAMIWTGLAAEKKSGRLLPVCCLCTVTLAMLTAVLGGSNKYLLGMCLYYIAMAAVVGYYHITFLRIAQSTKAPALWSVMGRMLDSAFVIITFIPGYSSLSGAAALSLDIAALCITIVLMAINGDLALNTTAAVPSEPDDPFPKIADLYGITPSEMKVLRELVLTDDKQDVIALRINISVSTLRHHITSIYKKTGISSRMALGKLVDGIQRQ